MSLKVGIFLLLLFFKHFLADFVIQTTELVELKSKYVKYLLLHSFHQAFLTLLILLLFKIVFIKIFIIFFSELFLHSFLDFLKARKIFYSGVSFPNNQYFKELGFDQFLHYFSYLLIAFFAF